MLKFSSSSCNLRSSAIRDLMGLAMRPDIISFAGGMPDNNLFPIQETDEIFRSLDNKKKQLAFQYGPTSGLNELLESLSGFLERKGLPVKTNRLMITTGSLQAINILAKVFIDQGDTILVENPCFIGALSAFQSYGANIKGLSLDSNGLDIKELTESISKNPKFLYITPYFHNPAGIVYSVERKNQLIETLKGTDIPIIEDDAYGDLYFYDEDKDRLKPIKAINPDGLHVCYTGSFSKIFGPGLRLGWMLVPEEIYAKCELVKQCFDACSPSFTQVLADEFIRSGKIYPYIDSVRKEYKIRAEAMTKALKDTLPDYVKFTEPRGGFYIWLTLPENANSTEILKIAIDKGAVFVIGQTFDPEGIRNNAIRISYCNTSVDKIITGVGIISDAIREVCG